MENNQLRVIENQQQPAAQQPGMITPAGSIEDILQQWNMYQTMKQKIGTADDFQKIGDKQHPKKSFVRKVQRFFNVSCKIIQDEPLKDGKGKIIAWLAKARAIHQATGAFQEADGSCSFDKKVPKQRTGAPIEGKLGHILLLEDWGVREKGEFLCGAKIRNPLAHQLFNLNEWDIDASKYQRVTCRKCLAKRMNENGA